MHRPTICFLFGLLLLSGLGLALSTSKADAAVPTDSFPSAFGPQTAVAILIEYPDVKHAREPAEMYDRIFPELNAFYTENSYNQTWFVGETTNVWLTAPSTASSYRLSNWGVSGEDIYRFINDAIRLADPVIDFSKYGHVFLVGAQDSIWGFAVLPGGLNVRTADGVVIDHVTLQSERHAASTYIHEMGHIFGLPDLYSYKIASQGKPWIEAAIYIGPWDPMSRSNERPHFTSWAKLKLGWITDAHIRTLKPGQISTTIVYPIELPNQPTYAARIPISESKYYLIEVRRKIGIDRVLPDQGVLVLLADDSNIWNHEGPLRVVEAHSNPERPWEKTNATFDIGPGEESNWTDDANDFSVVVSWTEGDAFAVHVTVPSQVTLTENVAAGMRDAAGILQKLDPSRLNTTSGRRLYADAHSLFNDATREFSTGQMTSAGLLSRKASQLLQQALEIEQKHMEVSASLQRARSAISLAEVQGRTEGLEDARRRLNDAQKALDGELFEDAKKFAEEAIRLAGLATSPQPEPQDGRNNNASLPYASVAFVVATVTLALAALFVLRRRKSRKPDRSA